MSPDNQIKLISITEYVSYAVNLKISESFNTGLNSLSLWCFYHALSKVFIIIIMKWLHHTAMLLGNDIRNTDAHL